MNAGTEVVKPLRAIQILEEEFALLHQQLEPNPADVTSSPPEDDEKREIELWEKVHGLDSADKRSAICFSGGGIRSATFCLGVIQALAARHRLERFHYMSSVSGGGYIASWLSSWIARANGDVNQVLDQIAPSRSQHPGRTPHSEPDQVRNLRAYSNYLSPIRGFSIDLITLIATFVRNLALHWLVLIPLIAAAVILPRINLALITDASLLKDKFVLPLQFLVALVVVFAVVNALRSLPSSSAADKSDFLRLCFAPILFAAMLESWILPATRIPSSRVSTGMMLIIAIAVGTILAPICKLLVEKFATPKIRQPAIHPVAEQNKQSYSQQLLPMAATGTLASILLYLLADVFRKQLLDKNYHVYAVFCVPAILATVWACTTFFVGLTRPYSHEEDREWWARASAWIFWTIIVWICFSTLVIFGPDELQKYTHAELFPAATGLLGMATGLYGYWSKHGARLERKVKDIMGMLGDRLFEALAAAFIVSLVVLTSVALKSIGDHFPNAVIDELTRFVPLSSMDVLGHLALFVCLLLVGAICGYYVGTNTFSIHSMYGNRLVRAYLGATNMARKPYPFINFDPADNCSMADLKGDAIFGNGTKRTRRLFHIVNVALNMARASGKHLDWQQRKAASFTISPLHSGSHCTGYQRSKNYSDIAGISLARAMTISGAAASPNMGYHTSSLVAFAMTIFNIRLGWWLPNPGPSGEGSWQVKEPDGRVPALVNEMLSDTGDDGKFVYLSDGGHFENLGLYEMVRRRCHHIVVVDASCDPDYRFEDLENAVRKIRVDLGISIVFPDGLPTPSWTRGDRHKHKHSAHGTIHYSQVDGPGTDGSIIYIKPVLSGDESLDVTRYAALTARKQRSPFPHHSTTDQFFDEVQFESYRELGYHSVMNDDYLSQDCRIRDDWPAPEAGAVDATEEQLAAAEIRNVAIPKESDPGANGFAFLNSLGALGTSWALPIIGVVGVAGGYFIHPTTVELKQPATVTLEQPAAMQPSLPVIVSDGARNEELDERFRELLVAMASLETSVKVHSESSARTVAEMHAMLDKALKFLDRKPGSDKPVDIKAVVQIVKEVIIELKKDPLFVSDPKLGEILAKLSHIATTLDSANIGQRLLEISNSTKRADPRTNVRATEGGH